MALTKTKNLGDPKRRMDSKKILASLSDDKVTISLRVKRKVYEEVQAAVGKGKVSGLTEALWSKFVQGLKSRKKTK